MSRTGDSTIIAAEKKMGINRFANPYFVQVILLGFTLGPLFVGAVAARVIANQNKDLAANSSTYGWALTGLVYILIILYGMNTDHVAHENKWFELSYCGDESDIDWAASFRLGIPVDLGEATPIAVPVEGNPKPAWTIASQKYGQIKRPETAKGHCWEIPFNDKNIPMILAWLPDVFDECFAFEGHMIQAFFRGLPFEIKNGTRGTFIRTSWTQDPDGRIIPIGVFSHSDYVAKKLRREMEPVEIPKKEAQALAQTRDNYYRHGMAMQLDLVKGELERTKKALADARKDMRQELGELLKAAQRKRQTKPDRILTGVTRKQQLLILALPLGILALGIYFVLKGGH